MIVNGQILLHRAPIKNMLTGKERKHGVSYGLAEAGYDIRIKQEILFVPNSQPICILVDGQPQRDEDGEIRTGSFCLASTVEEFQMPKRLVGVVHDKSTWARQGLSVYNTVIEPGWCGFLTLELNFRGSRPVTIPAGCGIAQVLFHALAEEGAYQGKYQNQEDRPVESLWDEAKDGPRRG